MLFCNNQLISYLSQNRQVQCRWWVWTGMHWCHVWSQCIGLCWKTSRIAPSAIQFEWQEQMRLPVRKHILGFSNSVACEWAQGQWLHSIIHHYHLYQCGIIRVSHYGLHECISANDCSTISACIACMFVCVAPSLFLFLLEHLCCFRSGPPNFFMSRQFLHSPQPSH